MTFLKFSEAKKLMRQIAKEYNLKNLEDWKKFTVSKEFLKYSKDLPKKPWDYYSKANVKKRLKKESKKLKPLGHVCNNSKCSWFEIGYSKKCDKLNHDHKPNGDIQLNKRDYNVKDAVMAQLDESRLTKSEKRDLLCEIICELKPKQEDAILAARILEKIPHTQKSMREMLDVIHDNV